MKVVEFVCCVVVLVGGRFEGLEMDGCVWDVE